MKIASIDIGYKNFCIYIEDFDYEQLKNQNIVLKKNNIDGSLSSEMETLLTHIFMNGTTIYHQNVDISTGSTNMNDIFFNMYQYLESISELLNDCDIILIEKQLTKNVKAMKLAQHCLSFFIFKYQNTKELIEFPSFYKTSVLGAPKLLKTYKNGKQKWVSLTKPQRKKWSVNKAFDILTCRNETSVIENISSKSKKDDLADTITMCQAFKYIRLLEISKTQK